MLRTESDCPAGLDAKFALHGYAFGDTARAGTRLQERLGVEVAKAILHVRQSPAECALRRICA